MYKACVIDHYFDLLSEEEHQELSWLCEDMDKIIFYASFDNILPQWNKEWGAYYSDIMINYQKFISELIKL